MMQHDIEKNGVISYMEFKALLLDFDDLVDAKKFELQGSGMHSSFKQEE